MKEALRMENITKTFGDVIANQDVTFMVNYGQIHALLGENGAGKSTLMNMLSGIYQPDSGFVYIDEKKVHIDNPLKSMTLGIGMVHQHFKLVEDFTVLENIIVTKRGLLKNIKKETKAILDMMHQYHLYVPLNTKISELSVGQKQRVEMIKVLYKGARILILDEPTAVLTPKEVEDLYETLIGMKENGCCVIVITHKLKEVMDYCDEVSVLHKGKHVLTTQVSQTSSDALTEAMVGQAIVLEIERPEVVNDELLLELDRVTMKNIDKVKVLDRISLKLYGGEILGVAGIAGSGQKELCEAIAGLKRIDDGKILFKNELIHNLTPRKIIKRGISMSFIPEDRLQMGLVANMDIVNNILLKSYDQNKGPFIDHQSAIIQANRLVKELEIVTPSIYTPIRQLSGGNIQKVLLGREIELQPKVIITAYAVRGLDIHATYQIYDLLNQQKRKGCGILFIGEDLDVLISLCDRIAVMCDGKMMGIVEGKKATKEMIGKMMAGQDGDNNALC